MAVDTFLKLGDIKGESKDSKHPGEIEILSWSFACDTDRHHEYGRRRRRRQGELQRRQHHARGRQGVAGVDDQVRHRRAHQGGDARLPQGGEGQQEYLIIKMNDILITSVQPSGSSEHLMESVSMNFSKIVPSMPQKEDGSLDAGLFFKYDVKQNKEG